MFRTIGRNIARSVAALSLVAAALFVSTSPASAHTLADAARSAEGCSWLSGGYSTLDSSPVRTSGGTTYGTVYLLWSSTYQQNCVVTLKTGSTHGTSTYTKAELWLQSGRYYYEQGNYSPTRPRGPPPPACASATRGTSGAPAEHWPRAVVQAGATAADPGLTSEKHCGARKAAIRAPLTPSGPELRNQS